MNKPAILLIGPTGSGKTPLGEHLATHGLKRLRFAHFDFGELLRLTANGTRSTGLSKADIERLQKILDSGALLENETFYIAEQIIQNFIQTSTADAVVLNGLPRHVEQAKAIEPWFTVTAVIRLQCSAETVRQRIQSNSGKDRTHRVDDDIALIQKKLDIFQTRTAPLCDYYYAGNVPVVEVLVDVETQPKTIVETVDRRLADFQF